MPAESDPQRVDTDEARQQLSDGLKSCRSVVQNYRLILTGDASSLSAANDADGLRERYSTDV